MAALSGRIGPQTTQPMKFNDVCDLCTFPRKYLSHVFWPVRWLAAYTQISHNNFDIVVDGGQHGNLMLKCYASFE